MVFIYLINLHKCANVPIESNNRDSVWTLDIPFLEYNFYHIRHTTNIKGNDFLPFLCLSILLVTGMLVVTVGGVVLGESTVAGNKDEKDVILQGAHDS